MQQCSAHRRDGQPCPAPALLTSRYGSWVCLTHGAPEPCDGQFRVWVNNVLAEARRQLEQGEVASVPCLACGGATLEPGAFFCSEACRDPWERQRLGDWFTAALARRRMSND